MKDVVLAAGAAVVDDKSSESTRNGGPRRALGDHCVVLKTKSCPTKATRIWKEHVRHVFGKKKHLTDDEIQQLKDLQDQYYRCSTPGNDDASIIPSVTFWVESSGNKAQEVAPESCYLLGAGDVSYVPASLECLREDVRNNGVSNQQRRKRKKLKNPPFQPTELKLPAPQTSQFPSPPPPQQQQRQQLTKTFSLTKVEGWKQQVSEICERWINKNCRHWVEQLAKKHLVDKLQQDLDKYASIWAEQMNRDCLDDYDQRRKAVHASLFLESINRLGNSMVDWYDQDLKKRTSGGATHVSSFGQGECQSNNHAGAAQGDTTAAIAPASESVVQQQPTPQRSNFSMFQPSLDGHTGSESLWTESNHDLSTSVTSFMDEDSVFESLSSLPIPDILPPLEPRPSVGNNSLNAEEDALSEMSLESRTAAHGGRGAPSEILVRQFGSAEEAAAAANQQQTNDYGDTRLYWQQQALKEKPSSGFLHWQKVAYPKLKTIQES